MRIVSLLALAVTLPFLLTGCPSPKNGNHLSSTPSIKPPDIDIPLIPILPPVVPPVVPPVEVPAFEFTQVSFSNEKNMIKVFWDGDPAGVTYTVCMQEEVVISKECIPLGSTTNSNSLEFVLPSLINDFSKHFFIVARMGESDYTVSNSRALPANLVTSMIQYIKSTRQERNDFNGQNVALSDDGNTLVVSAHMEGSAAKGIFKHEIEGPGMECAGAIYVYRKKDAKWEQEAYIKSSNTGYHDYFGLSLDISSDGHTIAVGAPNEDSNSMNDDTNNSLSDSGAVYVFQFDGKNWSQQAYLKAPNIGAVDYFGQSLSLNNDGNQLVVGAYGEDSNSRVVDVGQENNDAWDAGAAYTFIRDKSTQTWSHGTYLKGSQTSANHYFGRIVKYNKNGDTLAISATGDNTNATGVNGVVTDQNLTKSGAVYLFRVIEKKWIEVAYIKASNPDALDSFGDSLAFNELGTLLAVGATQESSSASGVNGDETDNSMNASGAVYLFSESEGEWAQKAYLKALKPGGKDQFGASVSFNNSGTRLAVGAKNEGSHSHGFHGNPDDNGADQSGAVYIFENHNETWKQTEYIKAKHTRWLDNFGASVALNGLGDLLAVGTPSDSYIANGINAIPQTPDNSVDYTGSVYVF